MKKIQILVLALFAVFATGVVAQAASAAPEWLVGGVAVSTALLVDSEGFLVLIDLKGGPFGEETRVECSGVLDGWIEAAGKDLITEALNLAGERLQELGEGAELSVKCLGLLNAGGTGCEETEVETEARPENLPWLTQLSLDEPVAGENLYLVLLSEETVAKLGLPAWDVMCLVLNILGEDLCEGETSADLELMVGPPVELLAIFTPEEQELETLEGTCTRGGVNTGALEGNGVLLVVGSTEEVDVSG